MSWTVVSVVPLPINETKNSLKPYEYKLEESDTIEPQVLVIDSVKESFWFPDLGKRGEYRDIPKEVAEVAKAVVSDYIQASLQATAEAHPGIFAVPGAHDADDIKRKFKKELAEAQEKQKKWLWNLVKEADDAWNKWHQHKAIAPLQIKAATMLGIRREWTTEPLAQNLVECPFCLQHVQSRAKVCFHCRRDLVGANSLEETVDA